MTLTLHPFQSTLSASEGWDNKPGFVFQGQLLKQVRPMGIQPRASGKVVLEEGAAGSRARSTGASNDPGLGPLPEGGESPPFSRTSPSRLHSPLAELKASRQCPNKWPLFLGEGEGKQALGSRPAWPALTCLPLLLWVLTLGSLDWVLGCLKAGTSCPTTDLSVLLQVSGLCLFRRGLTGCPQSRMYVGYDCSQFLSTPFKSLRPDLVFPQAA